MYKKQCNNITVFYSVDFKPCLSVSIIGMVSVIYAELGQLIMDARYGRMPAAKQHNFHSALRDRRIPMHPQGTIKAPASPYTTRAGGGEREEGRREGGAAEEQKKGWGLDFII